MLPSRRLILKKIIIIAYDSPQYSGRLRELIKVASSMGHIKGYFRAPEGSNYNKDCYEYYSGRRGLMGYLKFVIWFFMKARKDNFDILFVHDTMAVLPAILILLFSRHVKIVQDMPELYLPKEQHGFVKKLFAILSLLFARFADVVICANRERAEIVQRKCSLESTPFVYENIHRLDNSDKTYYQELERKYGALNKNTIRILSSDSCSQKRGTIKLLHSLNRIGFQVQLFIVGKGTEEDVKAVKKFIYDNAIKNVYLLGQLTEEELKAAIDFSDIGIVMYGNYDTNNLFCASGKLYEFIFEGKPIVASSNPPLVRMCEKYSIGVAGDDFAESIKQVALRYDEYRNNVKAFANSIDINVINSALSKEILEAINV